MDRTTHLVCSRCGEPVSAPPRHDCPGPAAVELHHDDALGAEFDPAGDPTNIRRYEPFLPVDSLAAVSLGEGGTDLVAAPSLSETVGVNLSLKLEGSNPTGSTKDRGSAVVVAHAVERGDDVVACASTGNAAASVAAYAARSNVECCLFVPERAPDAKAVQPLVYGADVLAVEGTYDDAFDLCQRVTAASGWLDRSAGATPYTDAGARTLGYELAEQPDRVPDWVAVPMGNGGTIASAWRGLATFADLDIVDGTPRMLGVQADGTAPIFDAVHGTDSDGGETCADSIDVGTPHRLADARKAIEESGGTAVSVSEEAIHEATARLGSEEGVFVEPACAAALAGVERAREDGTIDSGDEVVAVMTGTGLKDTATARSVVESPESVDSDTDPAEIVRRYSSDSE
jgi:threonine synthase